MIAKIYSAIPLGYEGHLVEVEGDSNHGLPVFNIVGMANKTINESKDRVRSALVNSGFSFPDQKVTVNLAPAELPKDGSHLDLPIALAILVLSKQLQSKDVSEYIFAGELSLDGDLRPVRGIINIVEAAKSAGFSTIFLPLDNLPQASLIQGINLIGVSSLKELFLHLKGQQLIATQKSVVKNTKTDTISPILDHIRGQSFAKRALSIAIAGHHNILISGPPGAGKTLLAKAAANLLPKTSPSEQIAITKLHSLARISDDIVTTRPFRAPHHTASSASIIGGGAQITPGEISLAHAGVLFLDEFPEFPRNVLEALRQPLEDHEITISRANQKATFPANFMLIATMNPCPCGYAGDPTHECTCSPLQLSAYAKKLSGPLLDRIDLHINVQKVDNADLLKPVDKKSHEHTVVKNNITDVIKRQRTRFGDSTTYNSSLSSHQVSTLLKISPDAEKLLSKASDSLNLSARAYFKTIKVAQTIADFSASPVITATHLAEALTYRNQNPLKKG